ncbi:hypothetical protein C0J52_04349 [Blattella germanica]|nr:hypothetical protein C0J52_04349 [Blattella germanica]
MFDFNSRQRRGIHVENVEAKAENHFESEDTKQAKTCQGLPSVGHFGMASEAVFTLQCLIVLIAFFRN